MEYSRTSDTVGSVPPHYNKVSSDLFAGESYLQFVKVATSVKCNKTEVSLYFLLNMIFIGLSLKSFHLLWLPSSHLGDESHIYLYVTQMNKYIYEGTLEKMPKRL